MGNLARSAGSVVGLAAAAAGSWIAYSHLAIDHNVPLGKAIEADMHTVSSEEAGELNCYTAREAAGRPLFLVHSVNAAASAYEMGPIFNRYRHSRPVLAMDLPGFGFSDRSNRAYSPRLYHESILEVLHQEVKEPVDLVALSLGCEFAARAAAIEPELFRSLTLISPTGFSQPDTLRTSQRANRNRNSDQFYRAFSLPLWGRPLFDLIATRLSIRYFLKMSFVGPVPEDMVDYAYATSHQPGAQNAPLYFISGKLFTEGVLPAFYERLEVPVQVIYDEDAFTRFDMLPQLVETHPNWKATRIAPTKGLPQFEMMDALAGALDGFWAEVT